LAFHRYFLVGWFIAKAIRKLVDKILERSGFDRLVERGGVKTALERSKCDATDIVAQLRPTEGTPQIRIRALSTVSTPRREAGSKVR
jgi:hypothetical protein